MASVKLQTLRSSLNTIKDKQTVNANSWRSDKSAAKRGYGHKWRVYRLSFLKANPLCVYCAKTGRVTIATVVDHIVPHRGDMTLFWQASNHQALCKACHDSVKRQQKRLCRIFMAKLVISVRRKHKTRRSFDLAGFSMGI